MILVSIGEVGPSLVLSDIPEFEDLIIVDVRHSDANYLNKPSGPEGGGGSGLWRFIHNS